MPDLLWCFDFNHTYHASPDKDNTRSMPRLTRQRRHTVHATPGGGRAAGSQRNVGSGSSWARTGLVHRVLRGCNETLVLQLNDEQLCIQQKVIAILHLIETCSLFFQQCWTTTEVGRGEMLAHAGLGGYSPSCNAWHKLAASTFTQWYTSSAATGNKKRTLIPVFRQAVQILLVCHSCIYNLPGHVKPEKCASPIFKVTSSPAGRGTGQTAAHASPVASH
eukprot:509106-Pelagomonas_calceolata.AAC.2